MADGRPEKTAADAASAWGKPVQGTRAHYREAMQFWREERYAEALSVLDEVEHRRPDHPDIMLARARCFLRLGRRYEAKLLCNRLHKLHRDRRGLDHKDWKLVHEAGPGEAPAAAPPPPSDTLHEFDASKPAGDQQRLHWIDKLALALAVVFGLLAVIVLAVLFVVGR